MAESGTQADVAGWWWVEQLFVLLKIKAFETGPVVSQIKVLFAFRLLLSYNHRDYESGLYGRRGGA